MSHMIFEDEFPPRKMCK